jgi:hypothetical protein
MDAFFLVIDTEWSKGGQLNPFLCKGRRRRPEPYYSRERRHWDFGVGRAGKISKVFFKQLNRYNPFEIGIRHHKD